jgi:serpin B
MVIVLPDEVAGATRLAGKIATRELAALLDDFKVTKEVDLAVPRFQASFQADLKPLFRQAGMVGAFDPGRADFSGITGSSPAQPRFAINDIRHRAVIDVTEWGTEGAAATVVSTRLSYMLADAGEPFVVDRPFLFYVVDQASGAVLFAGRISDPR